VVYYNKEAFEKLLWWLMAAAVIELTSDPVAEPEAVSDAIVAAYALIKALRDAEERSAYQVEKLKTALII